MKLFKLGIIILISAFVFSSCAIHSSFPFICFRSSCGSNQFSLKGIKKRVGGKLSVASRKRKAKKKIYSGKQLEFNLAEDTLSYNRGDHIVYTKFLIFIHSQHKETEKEKIDSLMVLYTSEFKDLTEASQVRLKHYLSRLYLFTIKGIYIRELVGEKGELRFVVSRRKRRLEKFISCEGIEDSKIVFLESK